MLQGLSRFCWQSRGLLATILPKTVISAKLITSKLLQVIGHKSVHIIDQLHYTCIAIPDHSVSLSLASNLTTLNLKLVAAQDHASSVDSIT
jgi:hypothetical protein